jgi:hypothetical protein
VKTYVTVFDWNWNFIGFREIDLAALTRNEEVDRDELDKETQRLAKEVIGDSGSNLKDFHCSVHMGSEPDAEMAEIAKLRYQLKGPDFENWPGHQVRRNFKPIRLDFC